VVRRRHLKNRAGRGLRPLHPRSNPLSASSFFSIQGVKG
jgi:hypothetical protein